MSKIQYTIRNIPEPVDQVIRKRAKTSGKSFNQTVVELLTLQTFGSKSPPKEQSVDWFFGSMEPDEEFDKAIAGFDVIDKEWWDDPSHTRH